MSWNKEAAISYINAHAGTVSHHDCATYTRMAIEAGGIYIGHTHFAKDYGRLLEGPVLQKFIQVKLFSRVTWLLSLGQQRVLRGIWRCLTAGSG